MDKVNATEKYLFHESQLFTPEVGELLQKTYFIMPTWKWIFIGVVAGLALFLRPLFGLILNFFKSRSKFKKNFPHSYWAYVLRSPIDSSLAWIITIMVCWAFLNLIILPVKIDTYLNHFLQGLIAYFIIKVLYNLVDATGGLLKHAASQNGSRIDGQLIPFAEKTVKFIIVALGFLIVLQSFGLNVASLLAGLGLGGLALALAAQDTAANLFGSITILLDRPFKVGDLVKVKELEGTVEEIGLRSTRIRTPYNSVITVPNAMMAKEYIDNMGARSARRIRLLLGLTYDTTPEKIEAFCDGLKNYLKKYDKVISESVIVSFNNFNESSLDILVNFHLNVMTADEETSHQQAIYLEFLKIAKNLNVEFAFPSRTLYHFNDSKLSNKELKANGLQN